MKEQAISNQQLAKTKTKIKSNSNPQDQQRLKQRAEALLKKIGEACDELDRLAEENPELIGCVTQRAEEHKDAYLRLKARLQLADAAPRCRWVKQDGTACGSPQMKKHIYCFAHAQMMEARSLSLSLPAAEDANAIQIGIMKIQKALLDDAISTKKAGLMLYSMQLAMTNVGQTTFGQAKTEEPVRQTVSEAEAFSDQRAAISQYQNPLTTKDTKATKGEEPLPLMNADDFDSGKIDEQFVPMPGGYGYTRVRLRVGPEAGTQPRAAAPHEHGEVPAKVG